MKNFVRPILVLAIAALLSAMPLLQVRAQDQVEPAVVVSITNADELLADINYLSNAANAQQVGGLIQLMAGGYLQLMDKGRPAGLYVGFDEGMPQPLGFLPINDLDAALTQLQEMIGPAQDVGNDVKRLGQNNQQVFVKGANGWAYFSNDAQNLSDLPEDPAALLGNLPQEYDLAVRVNVRNIPEQFRQMAVAQMRQGFEQQLSRNQAGEDEVDRELAEKLSRNSMQQLVMLVEDADQVTLGWEVDREAKLAKLEASITAVEGSKLAEQMELLQDSQTNYAGFQLEEAAATLVFNSKIAERDIEQTKLMLQALRQKALQELEQDPELKDAQAQESAKEVLNQLLDVAEQTIESGKLDGGAVMMLDPGAIQVAAGGYVADGAQLEEALRKLAELAKNEPDAPEVQFDAETHGEVSFHTFSVPLPEDEEEAQQFFGEQLDVVVGTAPTSAYVAFGKGSSELLKKVIDQSATGAQQVPPVLMKVAVGQILEMAASVEQEDQNLQSVAQLAKQTAGSDHVSLLVEGIERGVVYRLQVEEGVLRLIGAAIQQQQQGGGGGRQR